MNYYLEKAAILIYGSLLVFLFLQSIRQSLNGRHNNIKFGFNSIQQKKGDDDREAELADLCDHLFHGSCSFLASSVKMAGFQGIRPLMIILIHIQLHSVQLIWHFPLKPNLRHCHQMRWQQ